MFRAVCPWLWLYMVRAGLEEAEESIEWRHLLLRSPRRKGNFGPRQDGAVCVGWVLREGIVWADARRRLLEAV